MKSRFIFLLCSVFLSSLTFAQRQNTPQILKANSISDALTYSFSIVDGKITTDSVLSVSRKYNKEGNSTHTRLHDNFGEPCTTYEYLYDTDGIEYLGRNVFANPSYKLLYGTTCHYNKRGRLLKCVDFRPSRKQTRESKYKYNKLSQLTEIEFLRNGEKHATQFYKYDANGKVISSILTVTELSSSENGSLIDDELINTYIHMGEGHGELEFKEVYNDDGLVSNFTFQATEDIAILGADGMINLMMGDELSIDLRYNEDGLLRNKKQYLNGALESFVQFHYAIASGQ